MTGSAPLAPRLYQLEVLSQARAKNVIAYLDTGSGKTFISVLLIKDKYSELRRSAGRKVVVFLAPFVALVLQQLDVLRIHTDLRAKAYYGGVAHDRWTLQRWRHEVDTHHVLVMTPAVFKAALTHSFMTLGDVALLIFDECHHARGEGSDYSAIMRHFYGKPHRPHIFAMSASPVSTGGCRKATKSVEAAMQELEQLMDAEIITVADRSELEAVVPAATTVEAAYPALLEPQAASTAALVAALEGARDLVALAVRWRELGAAQAGCEARAPTARDLKDAARQDPVWQVASVAAASAQQVGAWGAAAALSEHLATCREGRLRATLLAPSVAASAAPPECSLAPSAGELLPRAAGCLDSRKGVVHAGSSSSRGQGVDGDPALEQAPREGSGHSPLLQQQLQAASEALQHRLSAAQWSGDPSMEAGTRAVWAALCATFVAVARHAAPGSTDLHSSVASGVGAVLEGLHRDGGLVERLQGIAESILEAVPSEALQAEALQPLGSGGDSLPDVGAGSATPRRLLTPKTCALVQELTRHRGQRADVQRGARGAGMQREHDEGEHQMWCGIVFVEQKVVTRVLARLARTLPVLSFLSAAPLVGYNSTCAGDIQDVKDREAVLRKFRLGGVNLLVATRVAEEGLDLRRCCLVVRFSLPCDTLSYVQSRGRARAPNATMVLLMEVGNQRDRQLVDNVRRCEAEMKAQALERRGLGSSRAAAGMDSDGGDDAQAAARGPGPAALQEGMLQHQEQQQGLEYCVESTGAKATLSSAKQLLGRFCSSLPTDRYVGALRALYHTQATPAGTFTCRVQLPNNSPLADAHGEPMLRKAHAEQSAALRAVEALHAGGHLDDRLLPPSLPPQPPSSQPLSSAAASTSTRPAEPSSKLPCFTVSFRPPSQLLIPATPPQPSCQRTVHIYRFCVLSLGSTTSTPPCPQLLSRADPLLGLQQLGLLLQRALPDLPPFQIWLQDGSRHTVVLQQVASSCRLPTAQLARIQAFHRTLVAAVTSSQLPTPVHAPHAVSAYVPEQEWARSAGGAWYILLPLHPPTQPLPSNLQPLAMAQTTPPAAACKKGSPAASGVMRGIGHYVEQREDWMVAWCVVGALEQGPQALKAAVALPALAADPSRKGIAARQLSQLLAGRVLLTSYNGHLYQPLHLHPSLTASSPFPQTTSTVPKRQRKQTDADDAAAAAAAAAAAEGPTSDMISSLRQQAGTGATATQRVTLQQQQQQQQQQPQPQPQPPQQAGGGTCGVQYSTFLEYYQQKYKVEVQLPHQPLLVAQQLGSGALDNPLLPPWHSSSLKRPLAEQESQPQEVGHAEAEEGQENGGVGADTGAGGLPLLVPELCEVHPLPGSMWAAAEGLLGAVMQRVQGLLAAQDVVRHLCHPWLAEDLWPPAAAALEACTAMSCHEGFSLERLEVLGDAVLKATTAIHLFLADEGAHQGILSQRHHRLVSNSTLATAAAASCLHLHLRVFPPTPTCWLPPGLEHRGELPTREVRGKQAADLVESLLGLLLLNCGLGAAARCMYHHGLLPAPQPTWQLPGSCAPSQLEGVAALSGDAGCPDGGFCSAAAVEAGEGDAGGRGSSSAVDGAQQGGGGPGGLPWWAGDPQWPLPQHGGVDSEDPGGLWGPASCGARGGRTEAQGCLHALEEAVGYSWRHPELLQEALTHCSWPHPAPRSYQRLEFLGDAVLELLVVAHLVTAFPEANPQQLVERKQAAVKNQRLAGVGVALGVARHLRHQSQELFGAVTEFATALTDLLHAEVDAREGWARAGAEGHLDAPMGTEGEEEEELSDERSWRVEEMLAVWNRKGVGRGHSESVDYMAAPKVLADVVEALVGAAFLDSGCSMTRTWQVVRPWVEDMLP